MIDLLKITRDECLILDDLERRSVHVRQALRSSGVHQIGPHAHRKFTAHELDILARIGATSRGYYEQLPLCPFCHSADANGHEC